MSPEGTTIPNDVRFFEATRLRLLRVAGVTRLIHDDDRCWLKVDIVRLFPVSDPGRFIGFLDGAGKDIGVVEDPSGMDGDSRAILAEELELRYFVPVVQRVISAKEEFGAVYWEVETSRGRKEVVVRNLKDSTLELPGGRVIITDVDGNRFEFPDLSKIDPESFAIIMRNL